MPPPRACQIAHSWKLSNLMLRSLISRSTAFSAFSWAISPGVRSQCSVVGSKTFFSRRYRKLADSWLLPSREMMCASELGTFGLATAREPLITSQVADGNGHGAESSRLSMSRVSGVTNFSTTPRRTTGSSRLISGTGTPSRLHVCYWQRLQEPGLRRSLGGSHLAGLTATRRLPGLIVQAVRAPHVLGMDNKQRAALTLDLQALFGELKRLGYLDGYMPESSPACEGEDSGTA